MHTQRWECTDENRVGTKRIIPSISREAKDTQHIEQEEMMYDAVAIDDYNGDSSDYEEIDLPQVPDRKPQSHQEQ